MTLAALHELLTAIAEPWQPWRERAACRGLDPALFFPGRGDWLTLGYARKVCAGCSVRAECLDYAQTNRERWGGVWGGYSERQRRSLRSKARRGEDVVAS